MFIAGRTASSLKPRTEATVGKRNSGRQGMIGTKLCWFRLGSWRHFFLETIETVTNRWHQTKQRRGGKAHLIRLTFSRSPSKNAKKTPLSKKIVPLPPKTGVSACVESSVSTQLKLKTRTYLFNTKIWELCKKSWMKSFLSSPKN